MNREEIVEEAENVWNCKIFRRNDRSCKLHHGLCTGVYGCDHFEPREDKQKAPESWVEFVLEVQRENITEVKER